VQVKLIANEAKSGDVVFLKILLKKDDSNVWFWSVHVFFVPVAARCYPKRGLCLHVCPSVCHVRVFCMSKWINVIFHVILVFLYQTLSKFSDRDPLTGAWNAGGLGKNRNSLPTFGSIACCERFDRQVQYSQLRRTVASWWH